MSLEHLLVPGNKEVLEKKKMMEPCQRDTGANCKSSQGPKLERCEQENKVILDYAIQSIK